MKPEVEAVLPIHLRSYTPESEKPKAAPVLPRPKKTVRINPVKYDMPKPAPALPVNKARAEELRVKLGLPKWKE